MSAVIVGLIAGALPMLGTWIAIRANGRERRKDQQATWDRDDEVAKQAAEAAALLLHAQQEAARQADAVASRLAEATSATDAKLDALDAQGKIIHGLVNKRLTDVTEQALSATLALLPHLEEAVARMLAGGTQPPSDAIRRVDETKRAIVDLRSTLELRQQNQAAVDARIANDDNAEE